jgi:hypothetical protein
MQQSFESSDQRLTQISVDLRKRMAEIQKLRELIEATEASSLATAKVQRTGVSRSARR